MKRKQSRKRKVVGPDSPNTQEKPVKKRLTYLPGDRRAPRASKYQAARAQNKPNLKWVEKNKTERPVFERLGPKEDKPKNPPQGLTITAPDRKNKKRRVTGPAGHAYCYMMSAQYNLAPLYGDDSDDDENDSDYENRAHCHMAGTPQDPHDSEREVQIEEEENEEAVIVNTRAQKMKKVVGNPDPPVIGDLPKKN